MVKRFEHYTQSSLSHNFSSQPGKEVKWIQSKPGGIRKLCRLFIVGYFDSWYWGKSVAAAYRRLCGRLCCRHTCLSCSWGHSRWWNHPIQPTGLFFAFASGCSLCLSLSVNAAISSWGSVDWAWERDNDALGEDTGHSCSSWAWFVDSACCSIRNDFSLQSRLGKSAPGLFSVQMLSSFFVWEHLM